MSIQDRARELRPLIEKAVVSLSDIDALNGVELFPHWKSEGITYKQDDRVSYNGLLYKCISAEPFATQTSWNPADATSLWVRVDNPAEEWTKWIQPVGAMDAYAFGAKVSHNNKHWISTYDNNTWEPGIFGWDEVV